MRTHEPVKITEEPSNGGLNIPAQAIAPRLAIDHKED